MWQYVAGQTLGAFLFTHILPHAARIRRDPHLKRRVHDITLTLLNDILSGLQELHGVGLSHIDLKPNNILVTPQVEGGDTIEHLLDAEYRAFVIDLGAVQPLSSRHPGPDRRVRLARTKPYFPTRLDSELRFDLRDQTYSSIAVASHGVEIDLHCFGMTLDFLFNKRSDAIWKSLSVDHQARDQEKVALWEDVFAEDVAVLHDVFRRCTGVARVGRFQTAQDAALRVATVPHHHARGIFAAELLTDQHDAGARVRVGDRVIKIAPPLDQVVDHPAFRRLRGLHQLALVHEVFPEATHTRFAHSLRTFDLAKRLVLSLGRKSAARIVFDRQHIEHLLAAALLHDLGQYPFSHCLEDLRKLGDRVKNAREAGRITENSDYLTKVPHDQERFLALADWTPNNGRSLRRILDDGGIRVESIDYLIQKRERSTSVHPAENVSRDILNGVIDVDRISYLKQDSQRTGVAFGAGIDTDALLEGLTVRVDEQDSEKCGLAIEPGALSAAEGVLAAVYWMYRNVYWHHGNRGIMASLKFVVRRLLKEQALKEQALEPGVSKPNVLDFAKVVLAARSEVDALVALENAWRIANFAGAGNPLGSLAVGGRLAYRRVCSMGNDSRWSDPYKRIVQGLSPDREDGLLEELRRALVGLGDGEELKDGEVLLDVPLKPRFRRADREGRTEETAGEQARIPAQLWVHRRWHLTGNEVEEPWATLEEMSMLAKVLREVEDVNGRMVRVFVAREWLDHVGVEHWDNVETTCQRVLNRVSLPWTPLV